MTHLLYSIAVSLCAQHVTIVCQERVVSCLGYYAVNYKHVHAFPQQIDCVVEQRLCIFISICDFHYHYHLVISSAVSVDLIEFLKEFTLWQRR